MRLHQRAIFARDQAAGRAREQRLAQSPRHLRRVAADEFDVAAAAPGAPEERDAHAPRDECRKHAIEDQLGAAELRELLADEDDAIGFWLDGRGGVRHGRTFSITSPVVLEAECRAFP